MQARRIPATGLVRAIDPAEAPPMPPSRRPTPAGASGSTGGGTEARWALGRYLAAAPFSTQAVTSVMRWPHLPAACILHRPSRRHLRWLLLLTPTPATRLQVLRRLKAAAREWERRLCCGLMTIGSLRLFAKLVQMARQRAVGDDEPGEVGGAMQTAMERERKQKKKEE